MRLMPVKVCIKAFQANIGFGGIKYLRHKIVY